MNDPLRSVFAAVTEHNLVTLLLLLVLSGGVVAGASGGCRSTTPWSRRPPAPAGRCSGAPSPLRARSARCCSTPTRSSRASGRSSCSRWSPPSSWRCSSSRVCSPCGPAMVPRQSAPAPRPTASPSPTTEVSGCGSLLVLAMVESHVVETNGALSELTVRIPGRVLRTSIANFRLR